MFALWGWAQTWDKNSAPVETSSGKLYWRGMGVDTLAESNLSGTMTDEFIYFAGRKLARRTAATGAVAYYFADHLGSTAVLTNATGTIVEESDYYPHGRERIILNGDPNLYKFTGYERDVETGLNYAMLRFQHEAHGRFMSPDPLGGSVANPQSLNRYAYVLNNPLNWVDPLGLCGLSDVADASVRNVDASPGAIAQCDAWNTFGPERFFDLPGYADPIAQALGRHLRWVDDQIHPPPMGSPVGINIWVACEGSVEDGWSCAPAPWSYKYFAPGSGVIHTGWHAVRAMLGDVYRMSAGPVNTAAVGTGLVVGANLALMPTLAGSTVLPGWIPPPEPFGPNTVFAVLGPGGQVIGTIPYSQIPLGALYLAPYGRYAGAVFADSMHVFGGAIGELLRH
jgi:RHS repeat-associated protein